MIKIKILLIFSLFFIFGCNSSILDDPSTSIQYKVEETSHVTIILLNSYDTEITTLVDSTQPAGNYQVSFDSSNLVAGIYFKNQN